MSNILERNLPFRFGVVPITETEDGKPPCNHDQNIASHGTSGKKMGRLLYHLIKVFGRKKTLAFLKKVAARTLFCPFETVTNSSYFRISDFPGRLHTDL